MIDIPDFVYPKDSSGLPLCPRCKKLIPKCDCPSVEPVKPKAQPINPNIRLDRSGRKGKIVTLITNLPPQENYLKDLAKTLKSKTGSGGTYLIEDSTGIIELQGDHKKFVGEFFKKQ